MSRLRRTPTRSAGGDRERRPAAPPPRSSAISPRRGAPCRRPGLDDARASVGRASAPLPSTASWKPRMSNRSPSVALGLGRAAAGSRAGRACRRAPGRAARCSGRPRCTMLFGASAVCSSMNAIACSRVQPSAWIPVSTTSRAARQASNDSTPMPVEVAASRGPSRRPGARCTGPSPRSTRSARGGAGTPAGPRSSWPIAIWRWWPGTDSWKASASGLVARPRLGLARVDVVLAGPRAVDRPAGGSRRCRVLLLVGAHPTITHAARGQAAEPRRDRLARPVEARGRLVEDLLAAGEVQRRIVAQPGRAAARSSPQRAPRELGELGVDPRRSRRGRCGGSARRRGRATCGCG